MLLMAVSHLYSRILTNLTRGSQTNNVIPNPLKSSASVNVILNRERDKPSL